MKLPQDAWWWSRLLSTAARSKRVLRTGAAHG